MQRYRVVQTDHALILETLKDAALTLTRGSGTANLAAFSALLFLIAEDNAFASLPCERSSRYCGMGVEDGSAGPADLTEDSWWALMVFLSWIF